MLLKKFLDKSLLAQYNIIIEIKKRSTESRLLQQYKTSLPEKARNNLFFAVFSFFRKVWRSRWRQEWGKCTFKYRNYATAIIFGLELENYWFSQVRKLTFKLSAHKNLNVNEAIAKASTPLAGRQITVNAIEKSSLESSKGKIPATLNKEYAVPEGWLKGVKEKTQYKVQRVRDCSNHRFGTINIVRKCSNTQSPSWMRYQRTGRDWPVDAAKTSRSVAEYYSVNVAKYHT